MAYEAKASRVSGGTPSLPDERADAQEESTVPPPSLYLPSHTSSRFPLRGVDGEDRDAGALAAILSA